MPPHSELVKSPTHASRIPIFAPTRKPNTETSFRVETSWGWAIITGRLGQQHRDFLDASMLVAENKAWTLDGRLHLLVDPAKLRSALKNTSHASLRSWARDLRAAEIQMRIEARDTNIIGGILDAIVDSPAATPHTRPGAFATGRRYWRLTFGIAWSKLIEEDLLTQYPFSLVVSLQYGISQATARYCYTHKMVNESISKLFGRLGATREVCKLRKELHADADTLAKLGINFDGERISWQSSDRHRFPVTRLAPPQIPGEPPQIPGEPPQIPGEIPPSQLIQ